LKFWTQESTSKVWIVSIRCLCIPHNFIRIKEGKINQIFTLENNPDADVIKGPNIFGRSYSEQLTDEGS
jgi:hypothetical protein